MWVFFKKLTNRTSLLCFFYFILFRLPR